MPSGDSSLLDSNILLRIGKSDDPQHGAISHALHVLVGQGVRLCYTSQTLGEFWNASTRSLDRNGFGLSVAETDRLARVIERDFELLPDSREVHDRWRSLLVAHNIQGVQVHDTRLAASMYVHGVGNRSGRVVAVSTGLVTLGNGLGPSLSAGLGGAFGAPFVGVFVLALNGVALALYAVVKVRGD